MKTRRIIGKICDCVQKTKRSIKGKCLSHSIPEIDALTLKKHKLRFPQEYLLGGVFC